MSATEEELMQELISSIGERIGCWCPMCGCNTYALVVNEDDWSIGFQCVKCRQIRIDPFSLEKPEAGHEIHKILTEGLTKEQIESSNKKMMDIGVQVARKPEVD